MGCTQNSGTANYSVQGCTMSIGVILTILHCLLGLSILHHGHPFIPLGTKSIIIGIDLTSIYSAIIETDYRRVWSANICQTHRCASKHHQCRPFCSNFANCIVRWGRGKRAVSLRKWFKTPFNWMTTCLCFVKILLNFDTVGAIDSKPSLI